jgi:hypothetical protein
MFVCLFKTAVGARALRLVHGDHVLELTFTAMADVTAWRSALEAGHRRYVRKCSKSVRRRPSAQHLMCGRLCLYVIGVGVVLTCCRSVEPLTVAVSPAVEPVGMASAPQPVSRSQSGSAEGVGGSSSAEQLQEASFFFGRVPTRRLHQLPVDENGYTSVPGGGGAGDGDSCPNSPVRMPVARAMFVNRVGSVDPGLGGDAEDNYEAIFATLADLLSDVSIKPQGSEGHVETDEIRAPRMPVSAGLVKTAGTSMVEPSVMVRAPFSFHSERHHVNASSG